MLEIIIFIIVIILAFAGVSWYSYKKSQERAAAFEKELDLSGHHDTEAFEQRFDALFEEELKSQNEAISKQSINSDEPHTPDLFTESVSEPVLNTDIDDATPIVVINDELTIDAEQNSTETDNIVDQSLEEITPEITDWDLVLALTIMSEEGQPFEGQEVLSALTSESLEYGDMQIYHRYLDSSRKQTLLSVANILDPGTLDPDEMKQRTTPGLLIFARLPAPISGLALFDVLFDTAHAITTELGGILCDDRRQPITDSTIEQMRSQVLSYQMSLENPQSNDYLN